MKHLKTLILRTLALIGAESAAIVAGGSLLGANPWLSAGTAGIAAALTVWANLGRAYYKDGKLTTEEENQAFSGADKENQ
jgi:hypothetical protein